MKPIIWILILIGLVYFAYYKLTNKPEAPKPTTEVVEVAPVVQEAPIVEIKQEVVEAPKVDLEKEKLEKQAKIKAFIDQKCNEQEVSMYKDGNAKLAEQWDYMVAKVNSDVALIRSRQVVELNTAYRNYEVERERVIDNKINSVKDSNQYRKGNRPDRVKIKAYRDRLRSEDAPIRTKYLNNLRKNAENDVQQFIEKQTTANKSALEVHKSKLEKDIKEFMVAYRSELEKKYQE